MQDVLSALERHAVERPGETFIYFVKDGISRPITFSDLWAGGARYANLFQNEELQPGSVVLISLRHCFDLYYAFLGALMCGCIPSFMPFPSSKQDPERYWRSHNELFLRIGAGAILYADDAEALSNIHCPLKVLNPRASNGQPFEFSAVHVNPNDVAFLQHSSGTTGLKKGVQLTYGVVSRQIQSYSQTLSLVQSDKIASWLPLYHDMGLIACFIMPLTLGIPIVSMDAFEWVSHPQTLFDFMESHSCTHTWLPNFAFQHLCNTADLSQTRSLGHVKAFINCSEPCKNHTLDQFARTLRPWGVTREQLQACYAMAETVFAVTQTPPGHAVPSLLLDGEALRGSGVVVPGSEGANLNILSVGPPIPDIEVRAAAPDGTLLEDGHVGEIAVSGEFLFTGYFKNPEATAASLRNGWYYTGDRGFVWQSSVYILGRIKEMIILNGQNFYSHDFEFVCSSVDGVKPGRCVAVGIYNEEAGSEELILIAETEVEEEHWADLRKRVKHAVMCEVGVLPKHIKLVKPGWLLKNTAGKIKRGENAEKYVAELTAEGSIA